MLDTKHGDIFALPVTRRTMFVNGVNCQGVMGAGIAKTYKETFPEMFEGYRAACATGVLKPGGLHTWSDGDLVIANIASQNGFGDASLEWLVSSLVAALDWADRNDVEEIRTPLVGGGLGGLDPELAEAAILATLAHSEIDSTLYLWP